MLWIRYKVWTFPKDFNRLRSNHLYEFKQDLEWKDTLITENVIFVLLPVKPLRLYFLAIPTYILLLNGLLYMSNDTDILKGFYKIFISNTEVLEVFGLLLTTIFILTGHWISLITYIPYYNKSLYWIKKIIKDLAENKISEPFKYDKTKIYNKNSKLLLNSNTRKPLSVEYILNLK